MTGRVHFIMLTCAGLIFCLAAGGCGESSSQSGVSVNVTRADGTKMSADDQAAAEYVRSQIDSYWVKAADGWVTELLQYNIGGQVMEGRIPDVHFRQLREFKFTVVPEPITEPMKLNGTDYRGRVEFEGTPERFYREVQTWEGPRGWSMWTQGNPAWGVLAIERRKGQWLLENSDLFEGRKPNVADIPPAPNS